MAQQQTAPSARGIWMLPSSDDEDERGPEEVRLLAASVSSPPSPYRSRWMRMILTNMEEYSASVIIPVLCVFAVYALTVDWYSTQTLVLSTNSSLLLEPSPWLINAVEVQVIGGQAGPTLYGFTSIPILGSEASWNEIHNVSVAPNQVTVSAMWLNKGSFLNITCDLKHPQVSNVMIKVLEEQKSTESWIEDFTQQSELQCGNSIDKMLQFKVPRDGNYSISVKNFDDRTVQIQVGLQVLATIYETSNAVYLCLPFPEACELQISLFGNKAGVLSTPTDNQSTNWAARVSYKVHWLTIASALGCAFLVASTALKMLNRLQLRSLYEREEGEDTHDEEAGWGNDGNDDDDDDMESEDPEDQLCACCMMANKDSFFMPCGHSVTCIDCGLRLKGEQEPSCPVCKEVIEVVKQIVRV